MLSISRFRESGHDFRERAELVVEFWRTCEGCESVELVQNLDDEALWAIVSRWATVGAYRRSFGGYDAKMALTPVLSLAIDEPSAYLAPDELGGNVPRDGGWR